MGRKPNPLITEFFIRGAKLNDSTNRYQHTCRRCGELFAKGRVDAMTSHLMTKCPAISEPDRTRATLEVAGWAPNRPGATYHRKLPPKETIPEEWSALETLAEASRQVNMNENRLPDELVPTDGPVEIAHARFDVGQAWTLEYPPSTAGGKKQKYGAGKIGPAGASAGAKRNPRVTKAKPRKTRAARAGRGGQFAEGSAEANLSVAAAATARLNDSLLDPQLADIPMSPLPPTPIEAHTPLTAAAKLATVDGVEMEDLDDGEHWPEIYIPSPSPAPGLGSTSAPPPQPEATPAAPTPAASTPAPPTPAASTPAAPTPAASTPAAAIPAAIPAAPATQMAPPPPPNRGGVRMNTSTLLLNGRSRHSRSRFTPSRRKEVQEVRKIGACIRCRILRKNCGQGTPCDTCRKVLMPRVWRTGCVRTKLHEQLDIYSAGVQVVLSQNRINLLKDSLELSKDQTYIELSHFADSGHKIVLTALDALLEPSEAQAKERKSTDPFPQAVMIDQDVYDVPAKVEAYVKEVLPLFIEKEPSKFMKTTLEVAMEQQAFAEDPLLRRALDLWALVESIDRERQWTILEKPGVEGAEPRWISEVQSENDADIYTMICMQLNAAAERKANVTSKALLNHMDRLLTDSKTKIGFKMYLTIIIFLSCVEKSSWAFKAWEQDHLRPGWPLERDPSVFAHQGASLAGLLKMLLAIRKSLPMTRKDIVDGKLTTDDENPFVVDYFQRIDLDCKSLTI